MVICGRIDGKPSWNLPRTHDGGTCGQGHKNDRFGFGDAGAEHYDIGQLRQMFRTKWYWKKYGSPMDGKEL